MAEYMDREEYCKKYCLSKNKRCDKENCFIWRTPIAVIPLTTHGWWENDNPICPCKPGDCKSNQRMKLTIEPEESDED